ncbi:alpha-hydroxy-acid oxidizing protein [Siccirubricoccus sp. KC 17139]|uniref:Alpha-hydroxy-acid oxidizing protein n=1 Tax=Siccirubricoccus soli TaxID=2899147 RepID=A0ABT1D410_9PROT|nr:alpha-hydroxy acid oxidase [Siccirubricoccus soli]MCO6416664.1 alpha-hydroxy-acid oxidizing protein [Siccirubricoccus soli]MCP2682799.1 alpha-hydroxy-acid oxidizing protein [Siccirubricoccus soli]
MYASPPIPPGTVALEDYEQAARRRIAPEAWAYIAGGSADELTLAANRAAFRRLRLRNRVLAEMTGAHTRLSLFGQELAFPILMAPVAFQRLVHPDGEKAMAFGAAAVGAGMVVSTQASQSLEDIAGVARTQGAQAPLWFQLYIQHDRGFTEALIRRAEAAGYQALVVTVDAPVSLRNTEQRAGFRLPAGIEPVNLRGMAPPPPNRAGPAESEVFQGLLDGAPSWRDIGWLRGLTRLPVLLKGIMAPEDAARAVAEGVDGIIVSNHGGRALDTLPASIEALPLVAEAVAGRVPVLMDGGIRRGTDVLQALALGARAVLVGRPCVYGLAVGGPVGVIHVLKILRTELEIAMALTGRARLEQIDRTVFWEEQGAPAGGSAPCTPPRTPV